MEPENLKIRIVSHLRKTHQVFLFCARGNAEPDEYVEPYAYPHIAPQSRFEMTLSGTGTVCATTDIADSTMTTREITIPCQNRMEVFDNDGALDFRESSERNPNYPRGDSVFNHSHKLRAVLIKYDGKLVCRRLFHEDTLLAFDRMNTALYVKLLLSDNADSTIKVTTFASAVIDYRGERYLTITLEEDPETQSYTINHSFAKF